MFWPTGFNRQSPTVPVDVIVAGPGVDCGSWRCPWLGEVLLGGWRFETRTVPEKMKPFYFLDPRKYRIRIEAGSVTFWSNRTRL